MNEKLSPKACPQKMLPESAPRRLSGTRNLKVPPRIKIRKTDDQTVNVFLDSPDEAAGQKRLIESLGAQETTSATWLFNTLMNALVASKGKIEEGTANQALAMLSVLNPQDEIESMLVAQIIATHSLISDRTRCVRHAETIVQLEANGTLLTKLQRTFLQQLEALQRYRGKGQQVVRVERVHVHDGGQAIVGSVQAGGQSQSECVEQPHAK